MSGLWCNCAACPKLFFPLLRFKVTLSCGLGEEANLKMFPSEGDTVQRSGCLCVSVHLCVCVGCLHDLLKNPHTVALGLRVCVPWQWKHIT